MKRAQAVLGAMVVFCAYLGLAFALGNSLHASMLRVESEGMARSEDGHGVSAGCLTLYGQALRSSGRSFNSTIGGKILDGFFYVGNASINCSIVSPDGGIRDLSRVFVA